MTAKEMHEKIEHRCDYWIKAAQVIKKSFPTMRGEDKTFAIEGIGILTLEILADGVWFKHHYYSMMIASNEDLLDLNDYLQCLRVAVEGTKN